MTEAPRSESAGPDVGPTRPLRSSLSAKVVLYSLLLSVVTVGTVVGILVHRHTERQTADAIEALGVLGRTAAPQVAPAIEFEDPVDAETILLTLDASSLIEESAVYDTEGRLFAHHRRDGGAATLARAPTDRRRSARGGDDAIRIVEPVIAADGRAGTLVLFTSMAKIRQRTREDLASAALVALVLVTLSTILAVALQRTVTRPVVGLAKVMRRIADGGQLGDPLEVRRADEVGDLFVGFDAMIARVRARDQEARAHRAHLAAVLHALPDPGFVLATDGTIVEVLADDAATLRVDPRADVGRSIRIAAGRAKELVHGLLVFGRRHIAELRPLDLAAELRASESMIRAIVRENIALSFETAGEGLRVDADPNQLQRVVVNLVVNAQDAMPRGGHLVVRLDRVRLDEASAQAISKDAYAGDFAVLSIADAGTGIPPEIASRIFEPFFTTKEVGKGSGLGLATVYGIVRDHRGFIQVHSEVGVGTTFRVHLPRTSESVARSTPPEVTDEIWRGSETILVVEDNASVRELVEQLLSDAGYTVLVAASGTAALELAHAHRGPIDLLLTDVILPGLDGREVHTRLARTRPETAVLYMSGHAAEVLGMDGRLETGIRMLWKPFGGDALLRAVRRTIEQARAEARTVVA